MSYGDEMEGAGARVIRLHLVPPQRISAPPERHCSECGEVTAEAGARCELCRVASGPVAAAFVQSTIADAIRQLDRAQIDHAPAPMALPLQRALLDIRRAFDALEPLVHSLHVGVVRVEENEFWAYPYPFDAVLRLGPFGKRRHAERALIEHALEHGDWDTETEWR